MHSSGLSLGHISCDTCSVDASFRCNVSLSQTMHAFFSAGAASSAADGLPFVPLPGVSTCLQPPPYRPRCQQHPMHAPLHSPATGTHSSSPYHRHKHPCCITLLMQPLHHNQRVGDRQPPCAPRNVRGVDHDQGGPRVRQLVLPLGD